MISVQQYIIYKRSTIYLPWSALNNWWTM